MKFINTKVHGILDYALGILLIIAPWLLDSFEGGADVWVPVIIGTAIILFSLLTDYEMGLIRKIPMRAHLFIDFLAGAFLTASPWIFGFNDHIYMPHLLIGIGEMLIVIFSSNRPYAKNRVVGYPPSNV